MARQSGCGCGTAIVRVSAKLKGRAQDADPVHGSPSARPTEGDLPPPPSCFARPAWSWQGTCLQ